MTARAIITRKTAILPMMIKISPKEQEDYNGMPMKLPVF